MKTFIGTKDIMSLANVGRNKALEMKRKTNEYSVSHGVIPISDRVCLAEHFYEIFLGKEITNARVGINPAPSRSNHSAQ